MVFYDMRSCNYDLEKIINQKVAHVELIRCRQLFFLRVCIENRGLYKSLCNLYRIYEKKTTLIQRSADGTTFPHGPGKPQSRCWNFSAACQKLIVGTNECPARWNSFLVKVSYTVREGSKFSYGPSADFPLFPGVFVSVLCVGVRHWWWKVRRQWRWFWNCLGLGS